MKSKRKINVAKTWLNYIYSSSIVVE